MRPFHEAATSPSAVASRTRRGTSSLQPAIVAGSEAQALLPEIDDLAVRTSGPATARAAWMAGTLVAAQHRDPWLVVVRDERAALRAAAVLLEADSASGDEAGGDTVTLAGCAMGHRSAILCDGGGPAALLGHTLAETVMARDGLVRVQLGPIDPNVAWLGDLMGTFSGAELVALDPIPLVRRAASSYAEDYLGGAMRRTLRKAANRAAADGRQLATRFTSVTAEIEQQLADIEEIHRERDHAQGRRSELDDSAGRRMWRARICQLAAVRQLELATLHIDGELASHVLAIADPPAYRVLEGNIATRWARYAPGRVLETAVLQRMLDRRDLTHLDWMTAVAPERLLAANGVSPVSMLRVEYRNGRWL